MKTTKHHEDGIEWLRSLRGKIAKECGHDLAKQSAVYRRAAAKNSYKVYRGESPVIARKRHIKLAA